MVDGSPKWSRRAPTVVLLQEQSSLGLCHVHLRDRIHARVRTTSLDHQLAAGASPESSVPIALHAARLCRPKERRSLAASLREVAAAARGSRRTRAPINRESIRLASGRARNAGRTARIQRANRRQRRRQSPHAARRRGRSALPSNHSGAPATRAGVGPGCLRRTRLTVRDERDPDYVSTSSRAARMARRRASTSVVLWSSVNT